MDHHIRALWHQWNRMKALSFFTLNTLRWRFSLWPVSKQRLCSWFWCMYWHITQSTSRGWQKGKIKPVHLVDVPGHSRLRPKLEEFLPQAAAIVFVVDALEFLPNCRAASEYFFKRFFLSYLSFSWKHDLNTWGLAMVLYGDRYLYDILTNANVVKKKIPVLLCCNKTDKLTAHTKEFIKKQMEKEM